MRRAGLSASAELLVIIIIIIIFLQATPPGLIPFSRDYSGLGRANIHRSSEKELSPLPRPDFILQAAYAYRHVDQQEFVRPRWPYDMRPSARAEKYMCVIVIR